MKQIKIFTSKYLLINFKANEYNEDLKKEEYTYILHYLIFPPKKITECTKTE